MRRQVEVLVCCLLLGVIRLTAQTTVTTTGGTTNSVPVFTGGATLGSSIITQSNGNIGIGTASPAYKLQVNGAIQSVVSGSFGLSVTGNSSSYEGADIGITRSASGPGVGNSPSLQFIDTATATGDVIQSYQGQLQFWQDLGPGWNQIMTINGSGNVGIGATNAVLPLTVAGTPGYASVSGSPSPRPGSLRLITNTANSSTVELGLLDAQPYGAWIQSSNGGTAGALPLTLNPSGGNVGIGTTTPGALLEIDGSLKLTSGSGASVTFADGTAQTTAWTGVLCGGDYAEAVDVAGDLRRYGPGDVLVIASDKDDDVEKASEPYSTKVVGIYATKPGVIGRRQSLGDSPDAVPMAMVGIVPAKVSAENGPVHKGDLLVTASIPGYAMKGTDRSRMLGAVIGKALGNLDSGTGVIEAVVTLQ